MFTASFLLTLVYGSLALTFLGALALIYLLIKDIQNKEVW